MRGYLSHIEKAEAKSLLKANEPTKWQKRRVLILWVLGNDRRNIEAIRKLDGLNDDQLSFGFENIKPMFSKELETIMIK
jgi:hypothetical protein